MNSVRCLFLYLFAITFPVAVVFSKLVNATIDDSLGDGRGSTVEFSPSGAWKAGHTCQVCVARPDSSRMNNGTWHDGSFYPTRGWGPDEFVNQVLEARAEFTGTAVYVYCAVPLTVSQPTGYSDMTFVLDRKVEGSFIREPSPEGRGFDYNVLVFSSTGLSSGPHTIVLRNGRVDGKRAIVLLDAIVYTYDDGEEVDNHSTNPSDSDIKDSPGHVEQPTESMTETIATSSSFTEPLFVNGALSFSSDTSAAAPSLNSTSANSTTTSSSSASVMSAAAASLTSISSSAIVTTTTSANSSTNTVPPAPGSSSNSSTVVVRVTVPLVVLLLVLITFFLCRQRKRSLSLVRELTAVHPYEVEPSTPATQLGSRKMLEARLSAAAREPPPAYFSGRL